jgi:TonB family protein
MELPYSGPHSHRNYLHISGHHIIDFITMAVYGATIMNSKKVILWPVIISIIGHFALILASGMIDLRDNVKPAEIFTVNIKEAQPEKPPPEEEKKKAKNIPDPKTTKEAKSISNGGLKEDTVNLGSSDVKYVSYLVKIKRKILQIWEYPPRAYEENKEGVAVVKMSLDPGGNVVAVKLMSSSGSALLDEGALGIVKAASPFDPLPNNYGLSRLHIVASFRYKLEK